MDYRYPDKPILTTPTVVSELDEKEWLAQAKYDGWRMPVHVHGPGNIQCFTSTGNRMESHAKFVTGITESFQEMNLPRNTVLDTEFVGPRGHLSPKIYILDILAWKGEWLCNEPYENRWQRCVEFPAIGFVKHALTIEKNFLEFFELLKLNWIREGCGMSLHEGIVLKDRSGIMKLDRKSSQKTGFMLKLKFRNNTEKID